MIPPSIRCIHLYLNGINIPGIPIDARIASITLHSRKIIFSPLSILVDTIDSGILSSENVVFHKY
jgi:hypothetical protein